MGCPLVIDESGEIYTGNLKGVGGSYTIGRIWSVTLLSGGVLRNFTREALVQDLLDCLPSPQY